MRRDARVVEEARLESVYTPKGYPGFESPSLRAMKIMIHRFYTRFYIQSCKIGCFSVYETDNFGSVPPHIFKYYLKGTGNGRKGDITQDDRGIEYYSSLLVRNPFSFLLHNEMP